MTIRFTIAYEMQITYNAFYNNTTFVKIGNNSKIMDSMDSF